MRNTLAIFLVTIGVAAGAARGQATTRPALSALDREMQSLFQQVQASTVRVQVPVQFNPQSAMQEHPLLKWVDPQIRRQIEQRQGTVRVFVERPVGPTTQPLTLGPQAPSSGAIPITPGRVIVMDLLGLVLDEQGRVLVPLYIEPKLVGEQGLRVTFNERQATQARLLGGDRSTNIAVLQLAQPLGRPVQMADEQPEMGALVVLMSPTRRLTRLAVWTGGQDEHAVVFSADGKLAGLMRFGHMLEPYAFGPVARQLVETGQVKRAKLGILVREIAPEAPERSEFAALADHPAARVETIDAASPAEAAGLQVGDFILSLGGEPVNDLPHFAAAVAKREGKTELRILRDGREQTLSVELKPQ